MIVLDSSALLAMLFFEPGCERVAELVPRSCMSTVNLAEVLGRLARDGRALDAAQRQSSGWASSALTSTASLR